MATKKKTTIKGVTTNSIRTMKPANDITEIEKPPKLSLIPTPILHNSFQITPLLNSSSLPIMLEKSFEDIISQFKKSFKKLMNALINWKLISTIISILRN